MTNKAVWLFVIINWFVVLFCSVDTWGSLVYFYILFCIELKKIFNFVVFQFEQITNIPRNDWNQISLFGSD